MKKLKEIKFLEEIKNKNTDELEYQMLEIHSVDENGSDAVLITIVKAKDIFDFVNAIKFD